ncbi:unnamed protein product [Gongylonema pulchrum]|uniref:DEAD domain-containing protein n=1 Tax=Gongylonema pulchrum TaxID=637853 RepID=A0A183EA06_9BILA|nr:unnamed protein product [Gongylonema pulchrum]
MPKRRKRKNVDNEGPLNSGKKFKTEDIENVLPNDNDKVYINCVSKDTASDILRAIEDHLKFSSKRLSAAKLQTELQRHFASIDEHMLVHSFSLCCLNSGLCGFTNGSFICIANTLGMAELPMNKLKRVPELIVFAPYTEAQLRVIISQKLNLLVEHGSLPLFTDFRKQITMQVPLNCAQGK